MAIERPKNRKAFGRVQLAAIRDQGTSAWLVWVVAEGAAGVPLWERGYRNFRRSFADSLAVLGLSKLGLTPASLGAGGAS